MASIELKEKNGVMTEVVRIADFEVYANDTVTTLKVVEKGYRSDLQPLHLLHQHLYTLCKLVQF